MSKILIVLLVLVMMTGCSFADVDAETIMRPPRATGEQAGIQAALEKTSSGNITFKYPLTGEYRSAIIMFDIDNDEMKEAIAFFRPEKEGAGAHMCVLDKRSDEWIVMSNITGPGADIDQVRFGDFDKDGTMEIIVGWSLLTTRDKSCFIYRLEQGVINELMSNESYTEMAAFDIDRDGCVELLTVFSSNQASVAKLLVMKDSTMKRVSDVRLDSAITSYTNVQTTLIDRETPAMVLEGYVSTGALATEILYWDEEQKKLIAPLNEPSDGAARYSREISFHPTDINDDGYVDFPRQIPLPGSDIFNFELGDEFTFPPFIEWNTFNKLDGSFTPVSYIVIGPTSDVWMHFNSDRLAEADRKKQLSGVLSVGDVTALQDNRERKITYYAYNRNSTKFGEPLLEIQVFSEYAWEHQVSGMYTMLEKRSGLVYAIRFFDDERLTKEVQNEIINSIEIRSAQ